MKLYQGDCMKTIKNMPNDSVQLIVTDPPYNEVNRDTNGLREINKGVADSSIIDIDTLVLEFSRICTGSVYVWCGTEQVSAWRRSFVESGWSTRQCVWHKTNPSPMNGEHIWLSGVELCIYAKKPKATFNKFCATPVWKGPSKPKEINHPTNKPLWLMETLIEASSNPDDIVFDPFMGSGTTGVACMNLNRKFIGIELDNKYFNVAYKRISNSRGLFGMNREVNAIK